MPQGRLRLRLALLAGVCTSLTALTGCASGPPKLKEGLWDIRGRRVENPGDKHTDFAYQLCRNHALDRDADARLEEVKGCNTVVKELGGGKFSSASTCQVAGVSIVSTGSSTYAKDEAVHAETRAVYSPPLDGKTDETLTEDQHYLGKCPSNLKPGDRVNPDGIVWHHDR